MDKSTHVSSVEDELVRIQTLVWQSMAEDYDPAVRPCPHCDGMGLISLNAPFGHVAFGRAFKCICQRSAILARHFSTSVDTLPDDAKNRDWSDFEPWTYAREALALARQIAEGYPATNDKGVDKPGLLLAGPTGCGKTTLAAIIYRNWHRFDPDALWHVYLPFIKDVQGAYGGRDDRPGPDEIIRRAKIAKHLALDDLGSLAKAERHEKVKLTFEDRIEILRQVIDYRSAKALPTVITFNLTIEQMYGQFGDLVGSRIVGLCHAVYMDGPDHRTGKHEPY